MNWTSYLFGFVSSFGLIGFVAVVTAVKTMKNQKK
jgi:hypothetical protein